MRNDDTALNELFGRYRAACPDPEPGPSFLPGVWEKIEARRGFLFAFGRLARTGTAAACALCLLLLVLNLAFTPTRLLAPSYADALAADSQENAEDVDPARPVLVGEPSPIHQALDSSNSR
jgi:hypothetical protein